MKFHASNLEYWSEGQVETVFFGNEAKNLALLMSNVPETADHYLEWNEQSNACINAVKTIELTGNTLHVQLAPNAAAQLGETEFRVDFESDEAVFEEVLRRLQHIFQDKLLVKRTALKKKTAPQQDYSKIKYLNLEGKNLVTLPEHVVEMTALETVKLSFSPKADVTAACTLLAQLPHVKYLTLRMEGGALPESFGHLSQLETLEITGLTRPCIFPENIGQLKKLRSLLVMGDTDVTLPESFAALTALEELNMRVNGWQLPSKFYQLSGLTRLDFTNCRMEQAPEEMAQMTAVDTVIFCSPEQRDYAQILSVVARMPNVKVLEMSVNPIPPAIGLCRQIEEFVIWGGSDAENPLQLPKEFWDLAQLRILSVNFGYLDKIPDGIGRLKNLKELSFMETFFETLPEAIGGLSSLELLNIKENPLLRSLPDGFCQLTQLKDMYLNDNPNLTALPSGMDQLTQLQSLRISNWETLKNVPERWKEMLLANG